MSKIKEIIQGKKWLLAPIIVVGFFVWLFGFQKSDTKEAINAIKKCQDKECVEARWTEWTAKLESKSAREKLAKAVKERLSTEDLSEEEIANWHKQFRMNDVGDPASMNIIIIPDFSHRVKELPHSKERDIDIISNVYEVFFKKVKGNKSKDKLLIDITDRSQAGGGYQSGSFTRLADSLTIDLSNRENEQAKKYIQRKENGFKAMLEELYSRALQYPSGADYSYYFRRTLGEKIKKSDINNEYHNKVIILTDGYLDTINTDYTKIRPEMKAVAQQGRINEYLQRENLYIPRENIDLRNVDILMLEITERPAGIGWHQEILTTYWKNWFQSMGARNIKDDNVRDVFKSSELSSNQIKEVVTKFLESK